MLFVRNKCITKLFMQVILNFIPTTKSLETTSKFCHLLKYFSVRLPQHTELVCKVDRRRSVQLSIFMFMDKLSKLTKREPSICQVSLPGGRPAELWVFSGNQVASPTLRSQKNVHNSRSLTNSQSPSTTHLHPQPQAAKHTTYGWPCS